jgi:quinoprotein glucose dehydrogenase
LKPIIATVLGMMVFGLASLGLHAQAGLPTASGIYTAPQAERGAALYQLKCSLCHGAELAGDGTAPPLVGVDFSSHWVGQPIAELFEKIHASMPSDQPGTLSAQQAADLVAYLLSANRFPAGPAELPAVADRLKQILLDQGPAAPAH